MQIANCSNEARKNNTSPKIVLVGPDFFNYIQSIRDAIITRGYDCSYFDERHSNHVITKIAYRLQLKWVIKKSRDKHLASIEDQIIISKTTDVFLIDTEVATVAFLERLRSHNIRIHLYMWDSAKNKKSFLKLLPFIDGKASFEPVDCERYGMKYIPLFAENIFSFPPFQDHFQRNDIVFLGTLHSHRANYLLALERMLKKKGLKLKKLLYYHSRFLYIIKCFLSPKALTFVTQIRTHGINKSEIADAYFGAKAVLDIHHPGQDGLTSRTFESLRAGARLITLNRTVLSLPIELRTRIILLDDLNQMENRIAEVDIHLPPLSSEMEYFLSLDRFVDGLLAIGGLGKSL